MRITGLRGHPRQHPARGAEWWTGGLYPGTSKVIVEILTDQGLVGLGEAPSPDLLGPNPVRCQQRSSARTRSTSAGLPGGAACTALADLARTRTTARP